MGCCKVKATGPGSGDVGSVSMQNIGGEAEVYVNGTGPNPFDLRTFKSNDDGTDPWGDGATYQIYQDNAAGNIVVGVPRIFAENQSSINVANVLTTLIDVTFAPDSRGSVGNDGEGWVFWWTLLICGDASFPQIDATAQFQVSTGAGALTLQDSIHCRWPTIAPSAPATRVIHVNDTNWSFNGGLRVRMQVATSNFSVFNTFELPRIFGMRYNLTP